MKALTLTGIAIGLSLALLTGCKKDAQNQDAVKQGIMNYLSKRNDLLAMDVSVTSVEFRQDEATATVHFQAKGNSSPAAGMNMQYVLDRKGSDWVVRGRTGANAGHGENAVPQGGAAPGGAAPGVGSGSLSGMPNLPPPAGGSGAGTLPPGHPGIGGENGQALPPGHPAVPPSQAPGK